MPKATLPPSADMFAHLLDITQTAQLLNDDFCKLLERCMGEHAPVRRLKEIRGLAIVVAGDIKSLAVDISAAWARQQLISKAPVIKLHVGGRANG